MSEKLNTAGKMVVLFSVTIILFAGISTFAEASDPVQNDVDDVQVKIDTADRLMISIDKEDRNLFTVNYSRLSIETTDEDYIVKLGEMNWESDIEDNSDARFPHLKIVLSADLEDKNNLSLGHLKMNLDVISYQDTSELTFSYVLEDLEVQTGGSLTFFQEVKTGGYSMLTPEETDTSEKLNSYRFDFQTGERGYYSWKNETSVNGESSTSNYIPLNEEGTRLVIISEFDSDDSSVSISPLDIEETQTGAKVPVPEPYDRIPSFVIGVTIGAGMAIGMLYKKRREFYQKKEGWETVSLEESSYYRGDE